MNKESRKFICNVGTRPITFETGKLAGQAGGSVTARQGDSIIFSAATMGTNPREEADFFPLTVEYEERMYAGGRIPGSFFRREGRPSTDAILVARLTDRPIRPLFNNDMRNEVQVVNLSLSADEETPLDILVVNAASASLAISDIPWAGPIGAVRVGRIDGNFIINPTFAEMEQSDLDLRIAGTSDAILMVECGANELGEDVLVKAIEFGHNAIQPIIETIEKMAAEVGKPKRDVPTFPMDETIQQKVSEFATAKLQQVVDMPFDKNLTTDALNAVSNEAVAALAGDDEKTAKAVVRAANEVYTALVRHQILHKHVRPDLRTPDQIRPIWCEVGVSPRAHGSGIFTRGETQAFTLATLGTPRDAQEIDSLGPVESKRYMHHYNFPPYCTGEARPLRSSSRREIGHGALAERALLPVIPPEDEFPYTIRLVSEIMSSNGSSSMASVCGSTLALMDTGVPIKAPVAGVAMGLIKEGNEYIVLTDIMGMEDHLGDMDFKVAGTETGVTALQMDIKIKGISSEIMSTALEQARIARLQIMKIMLETIPAPNPELKPFTPRITTIKIPIDKIGAIIGPGGKMIRSIQEETNTKIDINDDGTIFIAAADGVSEAMAREKIESLIEVPIIGHIYTGKVVRVADFGAFVQILPGMDGMVHISQLDSERVNSVEDIAQVGDELTVMVTAIDENGKIRLSRQAVLEGWTAEEAIANDRGRSKPSGGGGRSSNRGSDRKGSSDRKPYRR